MKKAQRPVDLKSMPWSYIGKDALDAAAERLWNGMRHVNPTRDDPFDQDFGQYHVQLSETQHAAQQAVLDVMGNAVPAMLRQRAKELKRNGASTEEADVLFDLADELDAAHS